MKQALSTANTLNSTVTYIDLQVMQNGSSPEKCVAEQLFELQYSLSAKWAYKQQAHKLDNAAKAYSLI